MKEMVGGCCVCSDDRGWAENPLVYCDGQGCTVAVHQACYGIVTVPTGNWYCRRCESQERSARAGPRQHCELCPSKDGAFKRTDSSGWAHVVCALYIPEVRFGNVATMEPILLQQIPAERFNKVCYICEESGKGSRSTVGACMQCNKSGCKQQFHVTCAQALGLLCEEAGNYLDNVKYCGYCQHHYSKLKKGGNVKTIPPYRPIPTDNGSDSSSPEKEGSESWGKQSGKRKLSSSSKSSILTTANSAKSISNAKSGTASPSAVEPIPVVEEVPVTTAVTLQTSQSKDVTAPSVTSKTCETTSGGSGGKFTTSNFVESVVTPSESVFGDSSKSGKKRKGLGKDEPSVQTSAIVSTNTVLANSQEDPNKRVKLETAAPVKAETSTPSVVVKLPGSVTPSTSPSLTPSATRTLTTTSPLATTSSIVVSVPLTAATLPPNAVTTAPTPPTTPVEEVPVKRGRSQSSDKSEKARKQKRGGGGGGGGAGGGGGGSSGGKRGARNSQATPPPPPPTPVQPTQNSVPTPPPPPPPTSSAPSVVHPTTGSTPPIGVKDSPPSSPESSKRNGHKSRKQTPVNDPVPKKEEKDVKLFQNGVSAPHMLGNQLNPASTMAQKMSDTLSQELSEAHSIFSTADSNSASGTQLIGPQLHSRVIACVRSSNSSANSTPQNSTTPPTSNSVSTNNSGSMWGSQAGVTPQTLDQLLERQWEQGSQFLMEQAQHFDIASLLSCLHQLRAENTRLEEHVNSLLQRRDHLLAVNARLAIPLIPSTPVNNIHPSTSSSVVPQASAVETNRTSASQPNRLNNSYMPQGGTTAIENGPPPSPPAQPYHRSSSGGTQPSPNTLSRHHSPGNTGYIMHPQSSAPATSGVVVQRSSNVAADTLRTDARRSNSQAPTTHPSSYSSMYQVSSQQSQIVIRRDVNDHHHQIPATKPS